MVVVRDRSGVRAPGRDTPQPGRPRREPRVDAVLALQRSAGNAATARLLRYDAYEHAKQGDHAKGSGKVTIAGIELTSGEINALADLYGSPEKLYSADAAELGKLVVLVRRQVAGGKVEESEWDDATGGRYTQLNLRNAAHFGVSNPDLVKPPAAGGSTQDNQAEFKRYFSESIVDAQEAYNDIGLPDPERRQRFLDRSMIAAGFAEHFIMDAFSAGHLFSKDDFIAHLKGNLDALSKSQTASLFSAVAKGVLADPGSRELLGNYEPGDTSILGWHPNFDREFAFNALLEGLYEDPEGRQAVYSALVKVVHDRLDTHDAGGGLVGVEVENDQGAWVMSGDRTLDKSPETQRRIDLAIEESRALLDHFRHGLVSDAGGYAPGSERVIAHFPRPTKASTKLIADMIDEVTDPARGTIPALIEVMKAELPSILKALEKRGKVRAA
jgi:hypothetical protein